MEGTMISMLDSDKEKRVVLINLKMRRRDRPAAMVQ